MTVVKTAHGYVLKSKKTGKNLSKKNISKAAAIKRERQVEYWKRVRP